MGKISKSGIASGTSGSKNLSLENLVAPSMNSAKMKLNNKNERFDSRSLRYSSKKFEDYLLNKNHPVGGSKAKFFIETLGYSKNDGRKLFANIKKAVNNQIPTSTEKTKFGYKQNFDVKLEGMNGKVHYANVTIIVQKDNNRTTYKVVSVVPRKKDK